MGIIFLDILIYHKGYCILLDLHQVDILGLSGIDTATVTLTIDIVLFTHLYRTFVTLILLKVTRKIMGGIDFLHIDPDTIDGL